MRRLFEDNIQLQSGDKLGWGDSRTTFPTTYITATSSGFTFVVAGTSVATVGTTGGINGTVGVVTATGSVQGDAAAITTSIAVCDGSDATKGVKLPTPVAGMGITVINTVAAILKVWPTTGAKIGAGSTNAAYSLAASKRAKFVAVSSTTWYEMVGA